MLNVTETPDGLLLAAPSWVGLLAILLGLALLATVVVSATPLGKSLVARLPFLASLPIAPWFPVAKVRLVTALAALVTGLVLLYASLDLLRASASFERRGIVVNGAFGEEARLVWSQVRRQEIEELARGRGRANYLVLYLQNGDYVPIGISGLPAVDAVRLQHFVRERIKR